MDSESESSYVWDSVDFEEPDWAGPGLVWGGYLVYRSMDGVEVYREWYPCNEPTAIATINSVLRGIRRRGRDDE
jgi:hypothetical protein